MADTKADALTPAVIWAQRQDRLLITIVLSDAIDPNIHIDEKQLTFSGTGGPEKKNYAVTIEFHKEVNPEESKKAISARKLYFEIKKKDTEEPFWPRLTSCTGKVHWLKTDFNLWMEEDDSDTEGGAGDGTNMDLEEMMKNMGGGMSNGQGIPEDDDEPDSDDEELPDLESK